MGKNKIKTLGIYIGVSLVIYLGFRYFLPLGAPFVLAFLLAALFDPQVSFLNKRIKIKRNIATLIVMLLYSAGFILVTTMFGGMFVSQIKDIIANIDKYYLVVNARVCSICRVVDHSLGLARGTAVKYVDDTFLLVVKNTRDKLFGQVMDTAMDVFREVILTLGIIVIFYMAVYYLTRDYKKILDRLAKSSFSNEFKFLFGRLGNIILVFVKTQGIILLIVTVICCVSLLFLNNPYWLILGIVLGVLDMLPVFGTGTILIPWALFCFFGGEYWYGAVLLIVTLACYLIREFLTPRIMGNELGINPVFMLGAVYVGIMLFGVLGVITGPIAFLLGFEIIKYLKGAFAPDEKNSCKSGQL